MVPVCVALVSFFKYVSVLKFSCRVCVCVCVCVQLVESGIMLRHRCTLINPHELQALIRQEEHATALEQHLSKFRDAYERQHQVLYEGSMELDDAKEPDPIPISSKAQELVASFDCLNALDQPAKDVLIKQIVETNPWEVEGSHSQLRDDDVSFRWLQLGCKLPPLTKRSEPISPLMLPPTPNQSRVLPTPSETTPNSPSETLATPTLSTPKCPRPVELNKRTKVWLHRFYLDHRAPCSGSEEKHAKKCSKRPRRKVKYERGKYHTQKVKAGEVYSDLEDF